MITPLLIVAVVALPVIGLIRILIGCGKSNSFGL
jgi:hypothetical protein